MRLLLDVHHSPRLAKRLSEDGHDVRAAADDAELRALPDDELLRAARTAGRVVVTENAKDFDRLARAWAAAGEHHAGIVLTSPRRFHRGSDAYPEDLIAALRALLTGTPEPSEYAVIWLVS